MGRPPCCDKVGIKKGPWTPEEDIILVSYIQENGPGNWRSVPTKTGLMRCSKSCRLRWTNYLRPGIKRGNFTPHEEGMIIHLQSLLGNRWAAITSYLPQRTDNDIKNYWNTHLKKKIKKYQTAIDSYMTSPNSDTKTFDPLPFSHKAHQETKTPQDIMATLQSPPPMFIHSSSSTYASSTENISRLLEGWMRSSPKSATDIPPHAFVTNNNLVAPNRYNCDFESLSSFENSSWEKSYAESMIHGPRPTLTECEAKRQPPLSLLENWLLDESTGLIELSADCISEAMF